MALESVDHIGRALGDIASISVIIATFVNLAPAFAALGSLVWTALRIYETKTVQEYLQRRRKKRGLL